MAQLSDDCFAFGGALMRADEALRILASRIACVVPAERRALRACRGRILAADLVAPRDVPPHDNAAVDGYAVAFDDLAPAGDTRLPVTARVAAGQHLGRAVPRGAAIRIFTGAPMPDGVDTVFMQEDAREGDGAVTLPPGIRRGANRRKRGEDIRAGATILEAGRRLRPQDIGLAASIGLTALQVFAPLKVAVLSSGDELAEPGTEARPGQVYDANRHALVALVENLGCEAIDLGIVADDAAAVERALARASTQADVVVTSGGMSTGEEDHMRAAVTRLGALHFWRLAIRPGRPVALGQVGGKAFVGLPGNPVAMMVTFMRFARPVLLGLAGAASVVPHGFRVPSATALAKKEGRREWLRARLERADDGTLRAVKFPRDGAGILTSLVAADGLIELPEELTEVPAGAMVEFIPFSEVDV
ncbi:MAG: molybdopterin molybdotransferase MoeA [Alphaproteobacteria bacterium]|nr:molybdopterin molybdotransferase MoeA [Alphaproteobacteria bacterium]